MSEVTYFLGAESGAKLSQVLESVTVLPAWLPFDQRAINFVSRFSQLLLTSKKIREFPELAALGHWFRAARLHELAKKYELTNAEMGSSGTFSQIMLGRGLAFHLAPANVDSVFMYSWLLSLLAGNTNIVRVSQKMSDQSAFLISILRLALSDPLCSAVNGRIVILTYPHNDELTELISHHCMLRVVWGGDSTVNHIRNLALRPTALELCFPDRFSAAAISATALAKLDETKLRDLAHGFYNDSFWFAQQACSSPRLLAWIGTDEECHAAQTKFWIAVEAEISRQQPENTPAMAMSRLNSTFEYAAASLVMLASPSDISRYPQRLILDAPISAKVKSIHCGNGLFLEKSFLKLVQFAPLLSDKEQTLAVFGFSRNDYMEFVSSLPARAVDRIVPIGDALGFAPVWDGQDLITTFTRCITIPNEAAS